ncbi:unnamed protein product [Sphenostylis stenocarpa]|uniref:Uncharacterized protein ycf68 n=1 Tax=Sphenostylis stenocarpa TaxID=92480 RepID=A0AA86W577_9FABA|nr:unnamed protein product [Sphenostylis stenocarpa]
MDSLMCSSVPNPEMWVIQGTLAWRTSPDLRVSKVVPGGSLNAFLFLLIEVISQRLVMVKKKGEQAHLESAELRDHPKDAFGIQGSRTDHRTLFKKWNALAIRSQVGQISQGLRHSGLPCGGCQRFESAYLQLVNLVDTKLYVSTSIFPIRQFDLCYDFSFMDVDKILPSSSTLGWPSLQIKGEVQTKKDLSGISRHPETRKGVVSDEMLWGVENKRRSRDSRYRSTF